MNLQVFIGNRGFWLIAETIFDCLSDKDLANCRLVCHQLRNFLNNEGFWKKRWIKKLEKIIMVKKYHYNANLLMSLYEAFPLWKEISMYYQEQPLPVFQHFVVSLKKQDRQERSSFYYSMDPLTRIMMDNDVEFVQLLIGSPVNFTAITYPYFPFPHSQASDGNALHLATRHVMEKMIDLLLKYSMHIGIDFNDWDNFGQTALHIIADNWSCHSDVQRCLKQLLDHAVTRNISINAKNSRGQTPFVVMLKRHACVKSLDLWMDYPAVPFKLKEFEKICANDLRNLIVELFKDMKDKGQNIEEAERMLGYPKICKTNRLYKTKLAGFRKPHLAAVVLELYKVRKEERLKAKMAKKELKIELVRIDEPKKKKLKIELERIEEPKKKKQKV